MNKFVSQYKVLSKEKRRDFIAFLAYTKVLKREDCIKLCSLINSRINKRNDIVKEEILEDLRKKARYDDKETRYLFSYLSKAVETYILFVSQKNDKLKSNFVLLRFYLDNNLVSLFEQKAVSIEKEINRTDQRSIQYFKYSYELYEMWYMFRSRQGRRGDMKIIEWKTAFYNYATSKMALQGSLHHSYKVYNEEEQEGLDDRAMHALLSLDEAPLAAKVYQKIYRLLLIKDNTEDVYLDIKTSIRSHYLIFDSNESKPIVLLIINYCIRMINQGKDSFQSECLEWYEWGLSTSILTEGKHLSRFTYKNMISLAIKFKRFEKATHILETYKNDLSKDEVDSIYNFNKARLYFYEKKYKSAMRILQMMTPPSLMDNLDGKRMLLRMYFEEGDYDLLDNHLANFKAFLIRHKEIGYHKTNYLNLVKYTSRLIRTSRKDKKKAILEQIKKDSNITDKEWLMQVLA